MKQLSRSALTLANAAALRLWGLFPATVRDALRCRLPLRASVVGRAAAVTVQVGGDRWPLRWLLVEDHGSGWVRLRLWAGDRYLADTATTEADLPSMLMEWKPLIDA